jgi:hypothetical protein
LLSKDSFSLGFLKRGSRCQDYDLLSNVEDLEAIVDGTIEQLERNKTSTAEGCYGS